MKDVFGLVSCGCLFGLSWLFGIVCGFVVCCFRVCEKSNSLISDVVKDVAVWYCLLFVVCGFHQVFCCEGCCCFVLLLVGIFK